MFITSSITTGLEDRDNIQSHIFAGTCSIARNAAKDMERPIINVVAPFTSTASLKAS